MENEDRFGDATQARRLHGDENVTYGADGIASFEEVRVNLGFVNLAKDHFSPQSGAVYIWMVNEQDELIVGVENVKDNPEAFVPGASYDLASKHVGALGYPTLAVSFTPDGRAVPGKGRISGELYEKEGRWTINDLSGRYSARIPGDHMPLLDEAKKLFEAAGISVEVELHEEL